MRLINLSYIFLFLLPNFSVLAGKQSIQIITSYACDSDLTAEQQLKIGIARIDEHGTIHITPNFEDYADCIELTDGITGEFVFDEAFSNYKMLLTNLEEDAFSLEEVYGSPDPNKRSMVKFYHKEIGGLSASLMFKMADYPNSYAPMWTADYFVIREKLKKGPSPSNEAVAGSRNDPSRSRSRSIHNRTVSNTEKSKPIILADNDGTKARKLSKTTLNNQMGRSQVELIDYVDGKTYYYCEWNSAKNKWIPEKETWRKYKVHRESNGKVSYLQQTFKDKEWKYVPEKHPFPVRYQYRDWSGSLVAEAIFYKNYRAEIGYIPDPSEASSCSLNHLYCSNLSDIKGKTQQDVWDEICEYAVDMNAKQNAAIKARKEAKVAAANNHKATNSIKGKELVDIDVEFFMKNDAYLGFNIIGILADGTRISTKDKGYLSDYEGECLGGELKLNYDKQGNGTIVGIESNKIWTQLYYTPDLPNDQVVLTIKSRFHDLSKDFSYTMRYDKDLTVSFNGADGIEGYSYPENSGKDAPHITVKANWCTHKTTGEKLIAYAFYKHNNGATKLSSIVKLKPGLQLKIETKGGHGKIGGNSKKANEAKGGDGGNGGNITFIADPSIKGQYRIKYDMSAGGYGVSGILLNESGGYRGQGGAFNGEGGKKGSFNLSEAEVILPRL